MVLNQGSRLGFALKRDTEKWRLNCPTNGSTGCFMCPTPTTISLQNLDTLCYCLRPRNIPIIIMVSNVLSPTEKQLSIEKAAREANPMEKLTSEMVFQKNGMNLKLYCKSKSDMSPKALKWAWKLAERNVSQQYKECSLGWQPKIKQADMNKKWARYLVAHEGDTPVAFCMFRFDLDYERSVLYW